MTTTRHEFLTMLHDLLKPKVYLEIGVQNGGSLNLAHAAEVAIGIDPVPLVSETGNQRIFRMTSNQYFGSTRPPLDVDLAFIDGSHLFEDALSDFLNIAELCHTKSVVVFDDVLPYSQEIAERTMPPGGDWTGDVWKVPRILSVVAYDDFDMAWVDTWPTGTFVVWNFTGRAVSLVAQFPEIVDTWTRWTTVPDYVLNRSTAVQPEDVIDKIREDLCGTQ